MKKNLILVIALVLPIIYFFTSCCKEPQCNKDFTGTFLCKVTCTVYGCGNTPTILFRDSVIEQKVKRIDDSTLIFKIEIGDKSRLYDTAKFDYINDTLVRFSSYYTNYSRTQKVITTYYQNNKFKMYASRLCYISPAGTGHDFLYEYDGYKIK